MARKKNIKKRETLPDPTYDSDIVNIICEMCKAKCQGVSS